MMTHTKHGSDTVSSLNLPFKIYMENFSRAKPGEATDWISNTVSLIKNIKQQNINQLTWSSA